MLAQRSGEAAKDIAGLIANSNAEIDQGVKLVEAAGHSLDSILSAIRRVGDMVAAIRQSGRDQSRGVDEIGKAIGHLDDMTQQNAGLSEESAAASAMLARKVGELNALAAGFRTGRRPFARGRLDAGGPLALAS